MEPLGHLRHGKTTKVTTRFQMSVAHSARFASAVYAWGLGTTVEFRASGVMGTRTVKRNQRHRLQTPRLLLLPLHLQGLLQPQGGPSRASHAILVLSTGAP